MKQINLLAELGEKTERAYVYSGFSPNKHNMLGSAAPTKTPPYNTGKVLIGSRYTPPPYREQSPHMLRLQRGLLEERTERRSIAAADMALYLVAAIAFIVIYLTR